MILETAYYCKNHDLLLALFSGANTPIGWVDKGSVDGAMNNSITKKFLCFFFIQDQEHPHLCCQKYPILGLFDIKSLAFHICKMVYRMNLANHTF